MLPYTIVFSISIHQYKSALVWLSTRKGFVDRFLETNNKLPMQLRDQQRFFLFSRSPFFICSQLRLFPHCILLLTLTCTALLMQVYFAQCLVDFYSEEQSTIEYPSAEIKVGNVLEFAYFVVVPFSSLSTTMVEGRGRVESETDPICKPKIPFLFSRNLNSYFRQHAFPILWQRFQKTFAFQREVHFNYVKLYEIAIRRTLEEQDFLLFNIDTGLGRARGRDGISS